MVASAALGELNRSDLCKGTRSCSIISVPRSAVTKRASGVSSGILVHHDYCAVWLPNKALCIRRRFSNEVAYLLERGRVGVSVRARISRCKIKKNLAHPTRFERVTFAFGGQRSTLRAALDRHNLLGIEPVVDPISPMLHQFWREPISASGPRFL